ncbi:methylated-DNA--[protein]-cysteine S-methyltransferase [Corynebacterium accolens]|uniref:methylated-DNA--[protein]-cysteine S-methyltransferase n=1 Tax=Corynebacterium accolens TaxID=38284 RepID=UPI002543917A|nr:methylated-DNA--[protein]-cysteine S-methyltransferase [Corynebacterium accolens]MDK4267640.1 methylated-DNA--[protein]-cysteine S-methyltransferase [Corynebacterium accolens]MDK4309792.1 methylated-DNA--[protein]-cysteine S-methyltransferase [Corynebacterium accolens]MDK4311525.1 methylated-DNA--[protein]-cysteine S-methyltransferase [Corynebacterium accolens]MDK4332444.1 methylated-DNA--[protein]-cysteine S-methyltransferase [Corynebacterium accolens]MDK4336191.1 methylated-DNA--[protein]
MLRTIDTPIGPLLLTADADGLSRVDFVAIQLGRRETSKVRGEVSRDRNEESKGHRETNKVRGEVSGGDDGGTDKRGADILDAAQEQLAEYFAGCRREFDLPLNPAPTTEFRAQIHAQLDTIGYGEISSYGELAAAVGRPAATRAVGTACGANPLPIIRPCHRVLRSDGTLGGYAGGLDIKRFLLTLEEN